MNRGDIATEHGVEYEQTAAVRDGMVGRRVLLGEKRCIRRRSNSNPHLDMLNCRLRRNSSNQRIQKIYHTSKMKRNKKLKE